MISEENRIAFIHIPRNGGISVMNALNIQIPEEVEYDDIKTFQNKDERALSYHKLVTVRCPWEREISLYQHSIKKNWIENISFLDYLNQIKSGEISNINITRNQVNYFRYPKTEGETGFNNNIDTILRLEWLSQGWDKFTKTQELTNVKQISHLNKSEKDLSLYNQEAKDLVSEIREEDIDYLSYTCHF